MSANTILENPILRREIRVRWRNIIAPAIVLLYCGVFGLVTHFTWSFLSLYGLDFNGSLDSAPGRRFIFIILPWQITFWVLIAPLISCGAIAGEREKSMLSALVLTGTPPGNIVAGKWLAAFAFQALFLIIPLPMLLTGMLMGGVAPEEILMAFVLQLVTAAGGSMLGVFCSSWCVTSARAFGLTLAILVALGIFLVVARDSVGPEAAAHLHPVLALIYLFNAPPGADTWSPCVTSVFVITGCGWVLYRSACVAVLDVPLDVAAQREQYREFIPAVSYAPPPLPVVTAPMVPEQAEAGEETKPPRLPERHPGRAMRSLSEYLPARSPIARRDMRIRSRGWEVDELALDPAVSSRAGFLLAVKACAVTIPLGICLRLLSGHPRWGPMATGIADTFGGITAFFFYWAIVLVLVSGVLGAECFTKERERGTLPEVMMTPLPSWMLTAGYLEGVLWSTFGATAWASFVLPLAFIGHSIPVVLAFLFLCVTSFALGAAVGLSLSWIGEHTQIATAGTLAVLLGYIILFWRTLSALNSGTISYFLGRPPKWIEALSVLVKLPAPWNPALSMFVLGLFHGALALFLLTAITIGLASRRRESRSANWLRWLART